MKDNKVFIFILSFLLLLENTFAHQNSFLTSSSYDYLSSLWGTRVPHIGKNSDLCKVQNFSADVIATEITARLTEINKLDEVTKEDVDYSSRTASEILAVSSCFLLDPLIFTSLISHESYFYNKNVSHTGAIGLGQLTSISLREIAQQLQADHIPEDERGSNDALEYFESAISCVETFANNNSQLKHWWKYEKKAQWVEALKEDTVLNLTYSAMIYKIAYSKTLSYFSRTSKNVSRDFNLAIESILNYYNGASESEQNSHYRKTRKKMNGFLETLNQKSNICYAKAI
jgi:hypothetical protein